MSCAVSCSRPSGPRKRGRRASRPARAASGASSRRSRASRPGRHRTDDLRVDPERDVVDEDPLVDEGEVDPAAPTVSRRRRARRPRRRDRARGRVPGGFAFRRGCRRTGGRAPSRLGDQRLRAVAACHPDHVGRACGLARERPQIVAGLEHHRLDPPAPSFVHEVEPLDLASSRSGVHEQDRRGRARETRLRRGCRSRASPLRETRVGWRQRRNRRRGPGATSSSTAPRTTSIAAPPISNAAAPVAASSRTTPRRVTATQPTAPASSSVPSAARSAGTFRTTSSASETTTTAAATRATIAAMRPERCFIRQGPLRPDSVDAGKSRADSDRPRSVAPRPILGAKSAAEPAHPQASHVSEQTVRDVRVAHRETRALFRAPAACIGTGSRISRAVRRCWPCSFPPNRSRSSSTGPTGCAKARRRCSSTWH